MSASPFAAPAAASSGVQWEDIKGALLLITVHSVESGVKTTFGEKAAVRADVVVLDGVQAGEEYADTLIFPTVLISQLRSRQGQKVLGRLETGNAKPGQKPPWLLAEATEDDVKLGTAHLAGGLAAPDSDTPPY